MVDRLEKILIVLVNLPGNLFSFKEPTRRRSKHQNELVFKIILDFE